MLCQVNALFKYIKKVEASSFIKEGREISASEKFEVRYDAPQESGEMKEETIKVNLEQIELAKRLETLQPYSQVIFQINIKNGKYGMYLELLDFIAE